MIDAVIGGALTVAVCLGTMWLFDWLMERPLNETRE